MSQFIESYFKTTLPKKSNMKFYFSKHNHQWSVHIIPVIDLYLETYSPIEHKRFLKDGVVGLFLSVSWLDKSYTFGICKKIK
jgi:hypothetical protein